MIQQADQHRSTYPALTRDIKIEVAIPKLRTSYTKSRLLLDF
jgi:hypothetical protein